MMNSGLLYLREIEDLAMSLSEILLLLEINLKRPFNSHERNATLSQREKGDQCEDTCVYITGTVSIRFSYQNGPLKIWVDAAEHQFPHDGGDGGEDEGAAQNACGRHVIGQRTGLRRDPRHWAADTWYAFSNTLTKTCAKEYK